MNPVCERCGATAKVMGIASTVLCQHCHKDASGAGMRAELWATQRPSMFGESLDDMTRRQLERENRRLRIRVTLLERALQDLSDEFGCECDPSDACVCWGCCARQVLEAGAVVPEE